MMSSYLVWSWRHGLVPLAWRLRSEGYTVQVVNDTPRYDASFQGLFDRAQFQGRTQPSREDVPALKELLASGAKVLSDSYQAQDWLGGEEGFFGVPRGIDDPHDFFVAGWFDGRDFALRHLLVRDVGLWPFGLGPQVVGGSVAYWEARRLDPLLWRWLEAEKDGLAERGFRGLVRVSLSPGEDGLLYRGTRLGWSTYHNHLLLAHLEQADLGKLLDGELPQWQGQPYSLALPVSTQPWPLTTRSAKPKPRPILGLTSEQRRLIGWHDVCLQEGQPYTAGLDGLIGVVRTSSSTLRHGREQALGVARTLRTSIPDLQYRPDAGGAMDQWLARLEAMGLLR